MAADHTQKAGYLRATLATLLYPVQRLIDAPLKLASGITENFGSRAHLLEENQQLRTQIAELKRRTLKYEALEKENMRLRAFLDNSFKLGENMLVAELLRVKLAPFEHLVLIDKGARFGVHVGQPVVSADGIVGQVVRVSPLNAEVLLITDPSHAIPVQINRNGLRAVAVGSGEINRLEIPNLPNNTDVRVGDLLVSSGLGGVFPQGYPVAEVIEVTPQPGNYFAKIVARPIAALDRIREVLVTWTETTATPFLMHPEEQTQPENDHAP